MCTAVSLQETERREDGSPASPMLEIKREKVLGDGLRSSVSSYMTENITELSAALGPNLTEVINSDVPDNVRLGSLEDRFMHMSNATASVGELEIVSSARFLQKTIVVVDEQFQQISVQT